MSEHADPCLGAGRRLLPELINRDDPGIALLRTWASEPGVNDHEIRPPDPATRDAALERLQVTIRSLLGAVVYETGGLLIDHGRLRVFGGGAPRSLWQVNDAVLPAGDIADKALLLIADDIHGGIFALDGGRFGAAQPGEVFHLPPDGSRWMPLEVGYSDFIHWCLTGDLSLIFDDAKDGDPDDASAVPFDKAYAFYPPLWTKEGGKTASDKRLVDANEYLRLRIDTLGFEVG